MSLAFFALIAVILRGALLDGFDNDGLGFMAHVSGLFSGQWLPFLTRDDPGHPAFLAYAVGLFWRLTGFSTWSAHLSIWVAGAVALTAQREIARRLLAPVVSRETLVWLSTVPALLLLAHPLFIAYTAQYLYEVPQTAFVLGLAAATAAEAPGIAALFAALLVTNKITGVVGVATVLAVHALRGLIRRRPAREIAASSWPYLGALGLFAAYLAIKLGLLHLPLNTFPDNARWYGPARIVRERLPELSQSLFQHPTFGAGPWLLLVAVGAAGAFLHRGRVPDGPAPPLPGWTPGETAALLGALGAANVLVHAANGNYVQPRYLLPLHATLILLGFTALVTLLGVRHRRLAIGVAAAWATLAVLRWRAAHLEPLRRVSPSVHAALRMPFLETTLDVRERILFYAALARDLGALEPAPCVFAAYPTADALTERWGGYVTRPLVTARLDRYRTYQAFRQAVDSRFRCGRVFVLLDSWDVDAAAQRDRLRADPRATLQERVEPWDGAWSEVYRLTR